MEVNQTFSIMDNCISSTALASMLGINKKNLHRDIRVMFKIDGLNQSRSSIRVELDNRGYVKNYYLPEVESIRLVAIKNIEMLKIIIQSWAEQRKFNEVTNEAKNESSMYTNQKPAIDRLYSQGTQLLTENKALKQDNIRLTTLPSEDLASYSISAVQLFEVLNPSKRITVGFENKVAKFPQINGLLNFIAGEYRFTLMGAVGFIFYSYPSKIHTLVTYFRV